MATGPKQTLRPASDALKKTDVRNRTLAKHSVLPVLPSKNMFRNGHGYEGRGKHQIVKTDENTPGFALTLFATHCAFEFLQRETPPPPRPPPLNLQVAEKSV